MPRERAHGVAATVPDPGQVVSAVRDALGEPLGSVALVSVIRPGVVGRPAVVTVTVEQRLRTPLLDTFTVPLSVRAAMAVEP